MSFRKEKYSDITQNTQFGTMWEWDENDGSHNQFFSEHYTKILRARNHEFGDNSPIEHELTGKKIFIDGEERWVESVHKHWFIGYYLVLLYYKIMEDGGHSHGVFEYENINSHCPTILEYIEENKERIKF
jgi:hypothetical protein